MLTKHQEKINYNPCLKCYADRKRELSSDHPIRHDHGGSYLWSSKESWVQKTTKYGNVGVNWLTRSLAQAEKSPVAGCVNVLPDFPGLDTFPTVVLHIHVAHLPHTPGLCHPDILPTVAEARHNLIHLTHTNTTVYLLDLWFNNKKCVKWFWMCPQAQNLIKKAWTIY